MFEKLINKLVKEGRLKKQIAGFIQVEALLKEAALDLEEANKIKGIAQRATYLLAYMAMLKAGRGLLLLNGYRPDDGAQHRTVVEMTGIILGKKYVDLVEHFETMRRKRNNLTYEAGTLLSDTETKQAFSDAHSLVKGILKEVKLKNPQIEINFDF